MENSEIIIAVIGVISVVVTHILDRRKSKAEIAKLTTETNGESIDNIDKSLDFYEKWVDNTNKRLDEVLKNQDRLMNENVSLRTELNTVKEQTTRMSTLLCTNLPCNQRVMDSSIIDCIYLNDTKQTKKESKQQSKRRIKN